MILDTCIVVVLAVLSDELLGDPVYRLHPVRLMGLLFKRLETLLRNNISVSSKRAGYWGGFVYLATCCLVPQIVMHALLWGGNLLPHFVTLGFSVYIFYSMYAQKDLLVHADRVVEALNRNDIGAAQKATSLMVGRDTTVLDTEGIVRATVESVAENFVDGSFAIMTGTVAGLLFSYLLGMGPLPIVLSWAVFYRSVNTLDAMVGYKNKRYRQFGWASARLDDVLNFIPARLSVLPLAVSTVFVCENTKRGVSDFVTYRRCTASINSGHPESYMSGALCIQLGGPIVYNDDIVDKGWIGSGTAAPEPNHIKKAVGIVRISGYLATGAMLVSALMPVIFHL